jgi:arsenite methyltransferase
MSRLEFGEDLAEQLDAFYRTRDVRRRRGLVLDALGAEPGEHVLDVGCGPGFYVADVLERVKADGAVTGIDVSPTMRAMTERKVADSANVSVLEGEATKIPLEDGAVDRALSVQVFEYVPDTAAALAELSRVVRPGGRIVIWDVDWSTLSWHSGDPNRMGRMLAAWDRHLVHPALPRTLGQSMRDAGFEDVVFEGHVFATDSMDPETFGGNLPQLIEGFVRNLDEVSAEEIDAWTEDLRRLDAEGAYFFALTQFCFSATRPG